MNTLVAELSALDLLGVVVAGNAWFFGSVFILRMGTRAPDDGWPSTKRSCYLLGGALLSIPIIGAILIP